MFKMEDLLTILKNSNITIFLVISILALILYKYKLSHKGIPPGPFGLPFVGYLPFLGKVPSEAINQLGKKYGSLFSFSIGSRLVVVLNDYRAINEAFVKFSELFAGRPDEMKNLFTVDDRQNLSASDGEFFRDHRRFIMVLLRDCGVGKLAIEPRLVEEIHYFMTELRKTNGKATDIRDMVGLSVANNIGIMALGKRFDYSDQRFLAIKRHMEITTSTAGVTSVLMFYPWLRYVPGIRQTFNYDKLHKSVLEHYSFLEELVDEHKKHYHTGQRDHYVTAYFTEQNARFQKSNKRDEIFTDQALVHMIWTLMSAGTGTTSSSILWALIYMIRHPDVQKKVQEEIDAMIGMERSPSWTDKLRTPYTEATICEIQRKANLVPMGLLHRNIAECELFGFKIPSNTIIIPNLSHVLSDPKLWGDPENFRPERFLNDKGVVEKPPYLIPFSMGKRQCPGETLAKMELYLYFTSLLQKFTFKSSDGKMPGLESVIGVTNVPSQTVMCAIPRY